MHAVSDVCDVSDSLHAQTFTAINAVYARFALFRHWGLVEKDSLLDLSLPSVSQQSRDDHFVSVPTATTTGSLSAVHSGFPGRRAVLRQFSVNWLAGLRVLNHGFPGTSSGHFRH